MIFPASGAPRLFAIPPGVSFAEDFAAGLLARLQGQPPEAAPAIHLLVNAARAVTALTEALADAATGPVLLPRISSLANLGADPLGANPGGADPGGAEPEMARMLRLTRLVEAFLAHEAALAPAAAAPALARALMSLEDELAEEGVDPAALDAATGGEFAEHWGRTLAFLQILRDADTAPAPPAKLRQRRAIAALVAHWREAPPETPVIAAGSTGSVGATALLLAAIARLPQGAVVLPGFDPGVDPEIWANLTPDHPMAPFQPLLGALDLTPADIPLWRDAAHPAPARLDLLTQALRPAPVTDAWQAARPGLARIAGEATSALSLVEAESPRREAAAIALAVRAALETPGRTVAVVTPDPVLGRRIAAELSRFGIVPDDSLGQPLASTPSGVFLRLVASLASGRGDTATALALLRHPMARAGGDRGAHLRRAHRYDLALRKAGPRPAAGAGFPGWPPADPGKARPEDRPGDGPAPEDEAWLAAANAAIAPFAAAFAARASLADLAAAHAAAAEALSAGSVWEGEDGAAARLQMEEVLRHASAHGPGATPDYPGLFRALMDGVEIRLRPGERHARVALWGTAEARIRRADLMILAGLNDNAWPRLPGIDPWLSRPMRAAIGLPPPERQTGLSAHDFMGAAASGEVILTRSTRAGGAPTVPSRWLTRLANLLGGADPAALAAMRGRGRHWLDLQIHTHRPASPAARVRRPAPRPPVSARPAGLSITGIEELVRDPYAIYARHVLGLRPLDDAGREADMRERGILMHELVQQLTDETMHEWPADPARLYDEIADRIVSNEMILPSQRRLWRSRMARLRDPFLAAEALRRETDTPVLTEAKARLVLGTFTLTGRIDRIDRLDDGTHALYDYKTGELPSAKQIGVFNLQLHLGALLLAEGGVAKLGPAEPGHAAYLGLTEKVKVSPLEAEDGDFARVVAETRASLLKLIAEYADPDRAYLSRARCQHEGEDRDFDHLARRGEWEDEP